ncbi:hypothetical protein, partial [Bradyrhizobium sp.]|uniref:hypothetical protein n=1 Tax=Bradyrhizobium sp. TaxID=376 RepID=UPI003C5B17A1
MIEMILISETLNQEAAGALHCEIGPRDNMRYGMPARPLEPLDMEPPDMDLAGRFDRGGRGQASQPGYGMVNRFPTAQSAGAMRRWRYCA